METIGAYDAKTHLPDLLKRVAQGEHFTITRHGQPVARLLPMSERPSDPAQVIEEILQFRQGRHLGDLSVRDLMEEGRP